MSSLTLIAGVEFKLLFLLRVVGRFEKIEDIFGEESEILAVIVLFSSVFDSMVLLCSGMNCCSFVSDIFWLG